MIDSFESDSIKGCQTSKEAEYVKSLGYTVSISFFTLIGHVGKMKRVNGFKLPLIFADIIEQTENKVIVKVLNKKRLAPLITSKLEELNN